MNMFNFLRVKDEPRPNLGRADWGEIVATTIWNRSGAIAAPAYPSFCARRQEIIDRVTERVKYLYSPSENDMIDLVEKEIKREEFSLVEDVIDGSELCHAC